MSAAFVNALLAALVTSALIYIQLSISGTRLVFSLPAYGVLAACALMVPVIRRTGREPQKWCLAVVAVFFSYILWRALNSPVEYLARADIYMVLACLMAYGISALFFQKSGTRLALMICIFGLAMAEVVFGIRQFSGDYSWMPFGFTKGVDPRASGTFISSIHFAGFLEAVAPFALAIAFWGTQKTWARWMCIYIAILCYIGVVISASRGGWLSSLFSLFVMAILGLTVTRRTNRARFPAAFYGVILTIFLLPSITYPLMAQSEMLKKRMESIANVKALSTGKYDIRLANWAAALDQWKVAPVLGTGAGTHLYYGRLFRRPELQPDPEHAHSDYLELLAEYGIVGVVGMLALLAVHGRAGLGGFRRLVNLRKEDPHGPGLQLAFNIGAICAFSAHAAHAVVDFNMHLPGNAIYLAIIFGFLANSGDTENSLPEPSGEPLDASAPENGDDDKIVPAHLLWHPASKAAAWSVAGLGVWMGISGLPKFPGEYWCEKSRVAVRNHDYPAAIAHGKKALESEKKNPFIYLHLGRGYQLSAQRMPRAARGSNYTAAVESFKAGLDLFPQDEELWVRYAQGLEGLGDYKAAGEAYREAINLDPNLGIIRSHYSAHLRRVGRETEAEEQKAFASQASQVNLAPIPAFRQLAAPEEEMDAARIQ